MKGQYPRFLGYVLLIFLLGTGGNRITSTSNISTPTPNPEPATEFPTLSITLGKTNVSQGIALDQGGDVDTMAETKGNPSVETRSSGNNQALSAPDGNKISDSYLQFNVDDKQLFGGKPTSHVRLEVDYFDNGKDSFSIQYDALSGKFVDGGMIWKTNTNQFRRPNSIYVTQILPTVIMAPTFALPIMVMEQSSFIQCG